MRRRAFRRPWARVEVTTPDVAVVDSDDDAIVDVSAREVTARDDGAVVMPRDALDHGIADRAACEGDNSAPTRERGQRGGAVPREGARRGAHRQRLVMDGVAQVPAVLARSTGTAVGVVASLLYSRYCMNTQFEA